MKSQVTPIETLWNGNGVGTRGIAPPGTWLEIKPHDPSGDEMSDLGDVCEATGASGMIAIGRPPIDAEWGHGQLIQVAVRGEYFWDHASALLECTKCDRFKFEAQESPHFLCPYCGAAMDDRTTSIALAAEAASLARFEHGERWVSLAEQSRRDRRLGGTA